MKKALHREETELILMMVSRESAKTQIKIAEAGKLGSCKASDMDELSMRMYRLGAISSWCRSQIERKGK